MALDKDRVHEIVEIFYQKPPFKTFYVNSTDGLEFCKPLGVFISLGITTSLKVLKDLRDVLNRTPGMKASIVEIESTKVAGQFMNRVVREEPESQYIVDPGTVFPNTVLGEAEANRLLSELSSSGKNNEYVKLRDTILRVTESGSWEDKKVMKMSEGGYRVFHRYVNYKKEGDLEKRLGIYVEEVI